MPNTSPVLPSNVIISTFRNDKGERVALLTIDGNDVFFSRGTDAETVKKNCYDHYLSLKNPTLFTSEEEEFLSFVTINSDETPYFMTVNNGENFLPMNGEVSKKHGLALTSWYCHPTLKSLRLTKEDTVPEGYIPGLNYAVASAEKKIIIPSTKADDKRKLNAGLYSAVFRFNDEGKVECKKVLKTEQASYVLNGWKAGRGPNSAAR